MKNFKSTKSGGLLAIGEPANELYQIKREIEIFLESLNVTNIWLNPLSVNQCANDNHPQQVFSEHTKGHLVHAACAPFFSEYAENSNGVYAGINNVHRLEPLQSLDPNGRLECFHVAEIIIVGDETFCENKYEEIKHKMTLFLNSQVTGCWEAASDSFILGDTKKLLKEEWVAGNGAHALAIASGNKHESFFLDKHNLTGVSCCFGIGIERLYEAKQRSKHTSRGDLNE